ncbi:MAG: Glycerate dehydrogenase [Candidatus Celerinatantimonas neptuna]|nr:MAG: Glycerate dehydrogenase [Candidatus Celerinatantimonas neptuna]
MATVVCLERDSLGPQFQLPQLPPLHEWRNYPTTTPEQIIVRLRDADVVVVNKLILNDQLLAQLPKLKLIAVSATGVNNIDLSAASRLGIKVCNVRGYAGPSVAEHTFMLLLALKRNLISYRQSLLKDHWQESGQFCYTDYSIENIHGQTMGIIGSGHLGQHIAKIAKAFGMKIKFAARPGQKAQSNKSAFEDVLSSCDVISIHCPLNEQTKNLISDEQFDLMQPGAILINTARGGIVNENALLKALQQHKIAGAGFDVSQHEPPLENSPLLEAVKMENFLLTPHIAWASDQSRQNLINQLVENIQMFLNGHPKNLLN